MLHTHTHTHSLNAHSLLFIARSFFQSVCTLGYCLLPLLLALLLSRILLSLGLPAMAVHVTRLVLIAIALCWSVFGE